MVQQYSSQLLEKAVAEFSKLPGIGRKTALRLVLHLLRREESDVESFTTAVSKLRREVRYCRVCHNISDTELCPLCSDPRRDTTTVCVVENVQDVMAIENTQQYRGLYHVLGGVISPIDGIGVQDIEIASLLKRVETGEPYPVEEVILALPTTLEGDTTSYYLNRQLQASGVKITTLARGVAVGDSLEYADEITLGRSIAHRIPFEN